MEPQNNGGALRRVADSAMAVILSRLMLLVGMPLVLFMLTYFVDVLDKLQDNQELLRIEVARQAGKDVEHDRRITANEQRWERMWRRWRGQEP